MPRTRETRKMSIRAAALAGIRDGLALAAPIGCVVLFVANVGIGFRGVAEGRVGDACLIPLAFTWLWWLRVLWPYTRQAWEWLCEYWRGERL